MREVLRPVTWSTRVPDASRALQIVPCKNTLYAHSATTDAPREVPAVAKPLSSDHVSCDKISVFSRSKQLTMPSELPPESPLTNLDIWWLVIFILCSLWLGMVLLLVLLIAFIAVTQAGNEEYEGWKPLASATVRLRSWLWTALQWWGLVLAIGLFSGVFERLEENSRLVQLRQDGLLNGIVEVIAEAVGDEGQQPN